MEAGFTFMVILAAPLVVASVAEPKVHVIPETDEQDKLTSGLKPPVGVTVTIPGTNDPVRPLNWKGSRLLKNQQRRRHTCKSVRELLGRNVASPPILRRGRACPILQG